MNAPRQGLFASLLILSFGLHAVLMVLATSNFLNANRTEQGNALTRQLVNDSLSELNPPNTIALALLGARYATNPNIASLRILDKNDHVLATGGSNKTRDGDVFMLDAMVNEQKVGRVEVILVKPSIGEQLRNMWLPLLLSALVHGLLWIAYCLIARPTRSEYHARLQRENDVQQEIQRLAEALEHERHQSSIAIAQAQQLYKRPQADMTPGGMQDLTQKNQDEPYVYLSIQFYDPKQLLGSVNQLTAQSYFNMAQLFLTHTRNRCIAEFNLTEQDIEIIQPFFDDGALVRTNNRNQDTLKALIQIAVVFQLLADAMYKRYREDKRFALQTRLAIAEHVPSMQLSAQKAASRLAQYLHGKELAIYLSKPVFKDFRHHYDLIALPHPSNALTRDALLLQGLDSEEAKQAQLMRDEILAGRTTR